MKMISYISLTKQVEHILNGIFYCKDVDDGQVRSETDIRIVSRLFAVDNYSIKCKSEELEKICLKES